MLAVSPNGSASSIGSNGSKGWFMSASAGLCPSTIVAVCGGCIGLIGGRGCIGCMDCIGRNGGWPSIPIECRGPVEG